ncbi:MAG: carboxypeptidase regulatory-like domain-containing protein [Frankiaceae bacterium]|nr:carboxypeptidase regulatory-like domain-containing protein [Frankiaceae bacterium]
MRLALRRIAATTAATLTATAATLAAAPVTRAYAADPAATGIHGTVTLPDASPAADVCVDASDAYGHSAKATTGADGTFALTVPASSYWLHYVDCGGRDLASTYFGHDPDVNRSRQVVVTGGNSTAADLQMVQGGEFAGTVTDDLGQPLSGVSVEWVDTGQGGFRGYDLATTDASGHYVLHGVTPGQWRLWAFKYHAYPLTWNGDVDDWHAAPQITMQPSTTTTVDIHMSRPGTISGQVVDDLNNPRSDITVRVYGTNPDQVLDDTTTDANGNYTVGNVFAEPVRIAFAPANPPYVWYGGGDTYAKATPVNVTPASVLTGIDQVVPRGPHIAGTVTDSTGAPVQGAQISLADGIDGHGASLYATTDADGNYVIADLPTKLFKVSVYPPANRPNLIGGAWPNETLDGGQPVVPGPDSEHIDFQMPDGGKITGTAVAAADGTPRGSVCVQATGSTPGGSALTGSDGTFVIQGLRTGDYRVVFSDCSNTRTLAPVRWVGPDGSTTVHVDQGQTTSDINGQLPPGASITGRVIDGSGNPIPQICIYATEFDSDLYSYGGDITHLDGTWSISGLAPGTYTVDYENCDPSGPWVGQVRTVSVPAATTVSAPDQTLHHGGAFSGSVIDQYGHPVYDVCIESFAQDAGGRGGHRVHATVNGTYNVGGLEPGTYTAYFSDCGAGMVGTFWQSASYETAVTFTVTEDGNRTGVDQQVVLFTLPSIPTDVSAAAGDGSATLQWQPPADDGHTPVTGYAVTTPTGTTTVPANARSFTAQGLTNGTTYKLSVAAINIKGTGDAASADATPAPPSTGSGTGSGTSAGPPSLTAAGPAVLDYGHAGTLSGRLLAAGGQPITGQSVTISSRLAGTTTAWHTLRTVATDATGHWSLPIGPTAPTSYVAQVAGAGSPVVTVSLRPRLSVSSSHRTLTFRTAPARPNTRLLVQRWVSGHWSTWRTLPTSAAGVLVVTVPSGGAWRGYLAASGYWAAASTKGFTLA